MKIGLVVYPGCVISGLMAFAEILTVANQRSGLNVFEIVWVDAEDVGLGNPKEVKKEVILASPNKTMELSVTVQGSILDSRLEAILLPGNWVTNIEHMDEHMRTHKNLIQTLKKVPDHVNIFSYCTAVAFIAESGLLQGKRATSTWWLCAYLEKKYQQVEWDFSQTILSNQRCTTASGLNGYLPIAQALIIQAYGNDVLRDIIDLMVLPKVNVPSLPLQRLKIMQLENELLQRVYIWVEKTAAKDMSIFALANAMNLTERTLARRVKTLTGKSCAQFMRLIKVNQASDYLIYTQQPVNQISHKLGFSDDASFRRLFKAITSYTPGKYRQLHTR